VFLLNYEENISQWKKDLEYIAKAPHPGILPSPPDPRDYHVEDMPVAALRVPPQQFLPKSPIILDQKNTGYCAGASGAGIANSYYHYFGKLPERSFSMTFLYWLAKEYDGIPHLEGTYIRTILKIMHKYGVASESTAPFSLSKISISPSALREAENYKIEAYSRLRTVGEIQKAIAKGLYIIMGTLVTRHNWNRPGGFLSYPSGELYGGHATYGDGYDNFLSHAHQGYFFNQNSWGSYWGDGGRFYLPYDYLKMTYEGRPVFLEAWGVKFFDVEPELPKEELTKEEQIKKNIAERIGDIQRRQDRRT
jgi:hypothetical protein